MAIRLELKKYIYIPTEKSYRSDNLYPPLEIRHEPIPAYSLQQEKKVIVKIQKRNIKIKTWFL